MGQFLDRISFRPFYKRIPDFLDNLFGETWRAKILALTATLNQVELDDICKEFRISRKNVLRDEIIMRTDVDLIVKKYIKEDEQGCCKVAYDLKMRC